MRPGGREKRGSGGRKGDLREEKTEGFSGRVEKTGGGSAADSRRAGDFPGVLPGAERRKMRLWGGKCGDFVKRKGCLTKFKADCIACGAKAW